MTKSTSQSVNDFRQKYLTFAKEQIGILALDFLNKNPVLVRSKYNTVV
jgi:hypothetical protein